jgi:autotransporter adhesin
MAIGRTAMAGGTGSVVIGNGATALGGNSIAIGNNSVANAANVASFGSPGLERRVINIAPECCPPMRRPTVN